jgi:hypothetical protein
MLIERGNDDRDVRRMGKWNIEWPRVIVQSVMLDGPLEFQQPFARGTNGRVRLGPKIDAAVAHQLRNNKAEVVAHAGEAPLRQLERTIDEFEGFPRPSGLMTDGSEHVKSIRIVGRNGKCAAVETIGRLQSSCPLMGQGGIHELLHP